MSEPITDAVGQTLAVGDTIAHARGGRHGVIITRREIVELRPNQMRMTGVDWHGKPNGKVSPWGYTANIVKIAKENA